MMKTIKENVGLIIALLLAIFIAIDLYKAYIKVKCAENIAREYVELIKTATNYENN